MEKKERMKCIADMLGVNMYEVYYACTAGKADVPFMIKESGFYTQNDKTKEFECLNGHILLQLLQDKRGVYNEFERNEKLRRNELKRIGEVFAEVNKRINAYVEVYGNDGEIKHLKEELEGKF